MAEIYHNASRIRNPPLHKILRITHTESTQIVFASGFNKFCLLGRKFEGFVKRGSGLWPETACTIEVAALLLVFATVGQIGKSEMRI